MKGQPLQTFNESLERAAQNGSEWLYGAVETDLAAIPLAQRLQYAPDGVLQYNDVMDTQECATFGPENILEAKFDYFYDNGMHPDLKQWFDANGYRKTGRFVFSKAFIGILSGTTQSGNSLKAPLDAILANGLIPELLPLEQGMSWDDYMNPKRITPDMTALGKEFNRRVGINYEKVYLADILSSLNDDLLDVAGHGWGPVVNNVYQRTDDAPNHAFALLTPAIDAFDNYVPFIKRLVTDYQFFDWAYSISVTRQTPYPDETQSLFQVLQANGLLAFFAEALKRLYTAPPGIPERPAFPPVTVPVAPQEPPQATQTPVTTEPTVPTVPPASKATVEAFCEAIKSREGWAPPGSTLNGVLYPYGTPSYHNNNPGNCRYSKVGYAAQYLPVLRDAQDFAVFKDYATGWLYLQNLVRELAQAHPTWTVLQFFKSYSPPTDGNDPVSYAKEVAGKLGVDYQTFLISQLV